MRVGFTFAEARKSTHFRVNTLHVLTPTNFLRTNGNLLGCQAFCLVVMIPNSASSKDINLKEQVLAPSHLLHPTSESLEKAYPPPPRTTYESSEGMHLEPESRMLLRGTLEDYIPERMHLETGE